jgi:hypothetical protein
MFVLLRKLLDQVYSAAPGKPCHRLTVNGRPCRVPRPGRRSGSYGDDKPSTSPGRNGVFGPVSLPLFQAGLPGLVLEGGPGSTSGCFKVIAMGHGCASFSTGRGLRERHFSFRRRTEWGVHHFFARHNSTMPQWCPGSGARSHQHHIGAFMFTCVARRPSPMDLGRVLPILPAAVAPRPASASPQVDRALRAGFSQERPQAIGRSSTSQIEYVG